MVTSVAGDLSQKLTLAEELRGLAVENHSVLYEKSSFWRVTFNTSGQTIFSASVTGASVEKINQGPYLNAYSAVDVSQCHSHKYEYSSVAFGEKTSVAEPQYIVDCRTLAATDLRRKYKAEANSHRNMLQRAPKRGNSIHAEFLNFRDFLLHVGPVPCLRASLDRVNNNDLEYAPGKVRWADKRTQNSNKSDTLLFQHHTKGHFTASRLAKLQKVSPGAIRQRSHRGWTDDEIIQGRRGGAASPTERQPRISVRNRNGWSKPIQRAEARPETPFERNAKYAAYHRESEGEEYCLADFEILNETATEVGMTVSLKAYKRKFAKWWPTWKPHLRLNHLPDWAQELVAELEGYSRAEAIARKAELRDGV